MVICLELGAVLHMDQLMPLPLNVSFFSKIQIGVTFLVPAHPGSPGKRAVKRECVCVPVREQSVVMSISVYVCDLRQIFSEYSYGYSMWAQGQCRISPPRFLANVVRGN